MVTNTDGYIHIIEYLTEHLSLFENYTLPDKVTETVMSTIEVEFSEQIINVCSQNQALSVEERNDIIREIDVVFHDLEEILSGVVNNPVNAEQKEFIKEFAGLIKNLFDAAVNK